MIFCGESDVRTAVRSSPALASSASNSASVRSLPVAIASMFRSISAATPGASRSPMRNSMMATRPPGTIASRQRLRILTQLSSSQSCSTHLSR